MTWQPPDHQPGESLRGAASPEHWRAGMRAILDEHALSSEGLRPEPRGSDVVWGTDAVVVKLTNPRWTAERDAEAFFCKAARGLPVAVPKVLATGELADWPYVITSRIHGTPLDEHWPDLDPGARLRVARELGWLTGALHRLPVPKGAPTEPWPEWLAARRADAVARQVKRGADLLFLADIPDLLDRTIDRLVEPQVLLHTEILDQHILVDDDLHPVGLLDFADGRIGHPAYDVAALVDFLFRGQPGLLAAFFEGYGRGPLAPYADDAEALMAAYLLHMFGSLPQLLDRVEERTGHRPEDLETLTRVAFG